MKYSDKGFYKTCIHASTFSRCLSRKIGAVLAKGDKVLITGFNGPPTGIPSCNIGWYEELSEKEINGCPRYDMGHKSGQGLEWCIAVHAERSAIINAAKYGIKTEGCTLYMSCGIPCKDCLVEIIDADIAEIVCTDIENFYDKQSKYLLNNSNLKVRKFDFMED